MRRHTPWLSGGSWPTSTSPKVTDGWKAPVEPGDIMVIVITGVGVRAWQTPLGKVQLQ